MATTADALGRKPSACARFSSGVSNLEVSFEKSLTFDPVVKHLPADRKKFEEDGFVRIESCIDEEFVDKLNCRLEKVLRGEYDTGTLPDKAPKLIKGDRKGPIGFSGNTNGVRVLQLINVWKCDSTFKELITSKRLGSVVARLAGWKHGARVAQDQIWAKPPGASPLVFHRDSPYFFFTPSDVVTVWVALDDMDEELGPLEYVVGSHKWGKGRIGSANMFFQKDAFSLLHSAADREGIKPNELKIESMKGLKRGGISVHNGLIWHGSKRNNSKTKPRRGIGIHFIPGNANFNQGAFKSTLWKRYCQDQEGNLKTALSPDLFPLTGLPS